MTLNVVDSSGWLEYLADGKNAHTFAEIISLSDDLIVPTISIYEVFKRARLQFEEKRAFQVVVQMQQGHVVDLDVRTALNAAQLSIDHKLPMADSIILATARTHNAILWTQDAHFKGLDNVQFIEKK